MKKDILRYTNIYPFHMPGHKRNKNFVDENLLGLDVTEVDGLDNLHSPNGIIKQAQENCAQIFGSKHSFFVVNGASCAIMTAVFSVCDSQDEIVVARNSHKSVYNAIELSGVVPHYLYSDYVFGISCAIDYNDLEIMLHDNKNIKAVFVTSPSYEGFCLDVKRIADIVHLYKKILIVDEAHGSHFIYHDNFPVSAIKAGADIVINSLHKTLPCLTQSAVLHINSDVIDLERVKKYLSVFQTTSPSYIFMATIDNALKKISQPNFFDAYVKKLLLLRENLLHNKVFKLVDGSIAELLGFCDFDISKLTFLMNLNGKIYIEKILRQQFFIQIEMAMKNYFVALSTIADIDIGFDMLSNAISELENKFAYECLPSQKVSYPKLKSVIPPKDIFNKQKCLVPLKKSLNQISADYVIPYPPGIPLIVPGELITNEVIEFINSYLGCETNLLGVRKNMLCVLKK